MTFERIAIVHKLDQVTDDVKAIERTIFKFCAAMDISCDIYEPNDMYYNKITPTLFVSIGGDGTMLHTVKESIKFSNSSVLGISAGRLNFLTDKLSSNQVTIMLNRILNNDPDLHHDERTLVKARFRDSSWVYALNEMFIAPPSMNAMMHYTIDINGKRLASQGGSGVLVATPTGSTAMAMSAGGAIMSPTSRGLQIVPIASHSLTSRPVIVDGTDVITITAAPTERLPMVQLIGDGQVIKDFNKWDIPESLAIEITAADRVAKIWRNDDWNFFNVLSEKMGWKV